MKQILNYREQTDEILVALTLLRDESAFEDSVCSVKEHVSGELFFATFEIRKDCHVHLAEIYNHIDISL